MTDEYHIFVSYTQEDGEIAASLASELRDRGIRPFVAQRDLNAGENWETGIREALKQSKCILCLITPRSKNSAWVYAEAGAAWVLDKPIVPALMFVEPAELIEIMRKHQARKIETSNQINDLIEQLRNNLSLSIEQSECTENKDNLPEIFNAEASWSKLLRIGLWQLDVNNYVIAGKEMHNYLLSYQHYVEPLQITAVLRFSELHAVNRLDAVNAGIVFGWTTPSGVRRYFNLCFNEEQLWLELVGWRGGDAYTDYEHLDDGIPFTLRARATYLFEVELRDKILNVSVRDGTSSWSYSTGLSESPVGRVGLRPWRSLIECERFEVRNLAT